MTTPLRVLILEDNPSDAYLMLNELSRVGFDAVANLVETEQEFRKHLQRAPDVVLADFCLPELSALDALRVLQECKLDVPFIVVSGVLHEEDKVEVLKQGAADCIMKESLVSLGPAVKQVLERRSCAAGNAGRSNGCDAAPAFVLAGGWSWARTAVERLLG